MKFGNLEGTSEEIADFFENNGLDAKHYFLKVEVPPHLGWVIAPAVIVFAAVLSIGLDLLSAPRHQWLAFLLGCLSTVWLGAAIQLRYKQSMVTGVAAIGCLAILVVAFGFLTPVEAIEQLKQLRK